jgi:hypothetical protein
VGEGTTDYSFFIVIDGKAAVTAGDEIVGKIAQIEATMDKRLVQL